MGLLFRHSGFRRSPSLGVLLVSLCLGCWVWVLIAACGAGAESSSGLDAQVVEEFAAESVFEASDDAMALARSGEFTKEVAESEAARMPAQPMAGDSGAGRDALQAAQRKVISTADITLKVEEVEPAINRVKAVVDGVGGYVEQLSTFGGTERVRANLTLRVPQARFDSAVSSIEQLGVVESRRLGSEDVSAEFIDLEARLKSSLREEESLLRLLERAGQVGEILAIERELFRVRADIERVQGQLNFLEQRVDLATIYLNLLPLDDRIATPPSGSLALDVEGVLGKVEEVKGKVESVDGIVDRVYHSLYEDTEHAELTILVHPQDFNETLGFLENLGDVKSRNVTEASPGAGSDQPRVGTPQSEIQLSLLYERTSVVDILKVVGIVLLVVILGVLVLLVLYLIVRYLLRASQDGEFFTRRR